MRIGLIGWYGHGNAGDERILSCLRRFFAGHDLLVTNSFEDALQRLPELNVCDFVLLGGGGLILRGTGRFAQLIERITPRFGCVGISIEVRHADNAEMIDVLKEKSEFILVRDMRSRELLDGHFKTIVGPDLTFLYPYEVVAPVEIDQCGLSLRPWRFWSGEHNGTFDRVMRKLKQRIPSLERCYPFKTWNQSLVVEILQQKFKSVMPLPLYFEPTVTNDRDILSRYFPTIPNDFSVEQFHVCRYLVGMRLHALIFACQAGIPFLSLSYQPKNAEFCRAVGVPELSLDICSPELLSSSIDRLKTDHAEIRAKLLEARSSSHHEITAIMSAIHRLITYCS